jgi:hypothetical protein
MQTESHKEAEVVANFQEVLPAEQVVPEQDDAKLLVQSVLNKRIARNPEYACRDIIVDKATIHYDENLTVVVAECYGEQLIGWAKFNPRDIRWLEGKSKKGKYWFRKESKYRDMAGIMKAIDRVVEKILNP